MDGDIRLGEEYVTRFFRVASYDRTTVVTTILFVVVLAYFAIKSALAVMNGQFPDRFDLLVSILLTGIIIFAWLRSVKGYRVEQGRVVIDRSGPGKVTIALDDVQGIDTAPDLGTFVRAGTFSTQGIFGWAGKIHVRRPTDVKSLFAEVYGTNATSAVVLRLPADRTVIVTPRDREGFSQALREAGLVPVSEADKKAYLPRPRSTYMPKPKKKSRK